MIYTVTLNPAIDYIMYVEQVNLSGINKSNAEAIYYGGKGINVSAVLKILGTDSIALGFTAGFTGKAIEEGVQEMGIQTDFIHTNQGLSRINIKIRSKEETDVNGIGPIIQDGEIDQLYWKIGKLISGDILILAGSIPEAIPDTIYQKMMEIVKGKDVKVIVDATKNLLYNALSYNPFLIKPNLEELSEFFDRQIIEVDDIIFHANKLQQMGAEHVLVSLGDRGGVFVEKEGQIWNIEAPKGKVRNTVGAGDSMLAGFLVGYLKNEDFEYALRLGIAAGSATAFREGLCTKKDIVKLMKQI